MPEARLVTLLSVDPDEQIWQESDLHDILEHQLDVPIGGERATVSFREALLGSAADIDLLTAAKDRARQLLNTGRIPRQIAEVLYYLAIARAWCDQQVRLTSMDADSCRRGLSLLLDYTWLSDECRHRLAAASSRLPEAWT